jgi:hypothetical protein
VRSKGERVVADALQQIQLALPFHLFGIHSDIQAWWCPEDPWIVRPAV